MNLPTLDIVHCEISDKDKKRAVDLIKEITLFFSEHSGTAPQAYADFIGQAPLAPHIALSEVTESKVKGWWCVPPGADTNSAILYLHGGAYAMGSAKAFSGLGSRIAQLTGVSLFLLDYPLSTEAQFPAAPNAAIDAFQWLVQQGISSIAIMGDSAGGGLALSTIQQIVTGTSAVKPIAGVVFSPWTDLAFTGNSWTNPNITDALIDLVTLKQAAELYIGQASVRHPQISPLYGNMKNLPPLLIQVGSNEHLLDDAVNFANLAAKENVVVRLEIWNHMHHVFENDFAHLNCSNKALENAADFLKSFFVPSYKQL